MMTESPTKILLFGEMEIDVGQTIDDIAKHAGNVASQCGYSVRYSKAPHIDIGGEDGPDNVFIVNRVHYDSKTRNVLRVEKLYYKNDQLIDTEPVWYAEGQAKETEAEKDARFKRAALRYLQKVKFGTETSGPAMQFMAINAVIKEYNIRALAWGYYHDVIGIETKKQYLFWRDKGSHIEFVGLVNKSELS